MKKFIAALILSSLVLSTSAQASEQYVCMSAYKEKVQSFYPEVDLDEEQQGWVYKLKGYAWLTKVVGKPAAGFIVAFVPGAIPVVLTASSVTAFFDFLKNERGITGAYIVLSLSKIEESELKNLDIDSKVEEEVLRLQENKYKKEHNLFATFVKRVNKKYKNSDYSYEQVRQAVVELANEDDRLCNRRGKEKFVSLNKLIRLTKKKLKSSI